MVTKRYILKRYLPPGYSFVSVDRWNRVKMTLSQRKARVKQKKEAFLKQQQKENKTTEEVEE